jgi:hypothetical protein
MKDDGKIQEKILISELNQMDKDILELNAITYEIKNIVQRLGGTFDPEVAREEGLIADTVVGRLKENVGLISCIKFNLERINQSLSRLV